MPRPRIINKNSKCLTFVAQICPMKVFSKKGKIINPDACIGCLACSNVCHDIEVK